MLFRSASPCTAPFMGTALGFAVTQPAAAALAVFAALGAGMAAPMLALSYSSRLREAMPRPGPWMDMLKQALAFPLYATVIWLLWVAGRQTGVNGMAMALVGCLALALALWLWSQSNWRRGLSLAFLALVADALLRNFSLAMLDLSRRLARGNLSLISSLFSYSSTLRAFSLTLAKAAVRVPSPPDFARRRTCSLQALGSEIAMASL